MVKETHLYLIEVVGCMTRYGVAVDDNVKGRSQAVSEKAAVRNVTYNWKKKNGYTMDSGYRLANVSTKIIERIY